MSLEIPSLREGFVVFEVGGEAGTVVFVGAGEGEADEVVLSVWGEDAKEMVEVVAALDDYVESSPEKWQYFSGYSRWVIFVFCCWC
jgi:hypothetical protein